MFVTIVQADVDPAREAELRSVWAETTAAAVPPGLIESSLLRTESGTWQIVTVWESREAVMAMRSAGRPAAIVMFESVGAKPVVSLWDVEGRLSAER
jgi:heme-degrading monooxygenase HmoA